MSKHSRPSRLSTLVAGAEKDQLGKGLRWALDFNRDSYRGAAFEPADDRSEESTSKPPGGKILRVSEFELQYHPRQEEGNHETGRMV